MGGRGTFAAGRSVPYTYRTVGYMTGVKIVAPIDEKRSASMPVESHSSNKYILLDKKNNIFRQYREYNNEHRIIKEIGYHFEKDLSENGKKVFHIHEYSKPGIEYRQKGRLMTDVEVQAYRRYFKNVTEKEINEYLDYYKRRKQI